MQLDPNYQFHKQIALLCAVFDNVLTLYPRPGYMKERSTIAVIGLSVHTAPVEMREKLAVAEELWPRAIQELTSLNHIEEAAVLSTCNRMESYVLALSWNRGIREVVDWMSKVRTNRSTLSAQSSCRSFLAAQRNIRKDSLMSVSFLRFHRKVVFLLLSLRSTYSCCVTVMLHAICSRYQLGWTLWFSVKDKSLLKSNKL